MYLNSEPSLICFSKRHSSPRYNLCPVPKMWTLCLKDYRSFYVDTNLLIMRSIECAAAQSLKNRTFMTVQIVSALNVRYNSLFRFILFMFTYPHIFLTYFFCFCPLVLGHGLEVFGGSTFWNQKQTIQHSHAALSVILYLFFSFDHHKT